jgi:hypothetical protein
MTSKERFCTSFLRAGFAAVLLASLGQSSFASPITLAVSGMVATSTVSGAQVGAGTYSIQQLMSAGAASGSVTSRGETGISLWSLLGGNSSGTSDVVTSTPTGDNSKNAILRSYVLATSLTGAESIISLGEIDPFFGGTGALPPFVAYSGTDGNPALIFPGAGASGRDVTDLASLQILSVPALVRGSGGLSASLMLGGSVATPGNYNLAALQALPSSSVNIGGDVYTGVPLWSLLTPTVSNVLSGYVIASGTDGYEVLYSLAELDPNFGAPLDLVPYADTQGAFPSDGFARIVIPGDNHQGRYVSNLDSIQVAAVPEPGTFILIGSLFAFVILGDRLRRARYPTSAKGCPSLFDRFNGAGSEEARLRAGLRPPL